MEDDQGLDHKNAGDNDNPRVIDELQVRGASLNQGEITADENSLRLRPKTSPGHPVQSTSPAHEQFSITKHKTEFDFRQPRYEVNKYSSYEEMLNQMNSDDPFSGQVPPPKEKQPKKDKVNNNKRNLSTTNKSKQRTQFSGINSGKKIENLSTRFAPKDTLNSTYTVSHDNPAFNPNITETRPDSVLSSGTYTLERSNSKTKLVDEGSSYTPRSRDKMNTTRRNVKEGSKMRMDSRGKRITLDAIDEPDTFLSTKKLATGELDIIVPSFQLQPSRKSVVRYVQGNINQRQCKHYLPKLNEKVSLGLCQCGRDLDWHSDEKVHISHEVTGEKWQPETHSRTMPTTAFGTIRFHGFGQQASRNAPYIRVDRHADMQSVWVLLSDYWHMPPPKLLISVTGGAKRFFLKNRLKAGFKRGLVKAATTTGAWIITGGTNAGVMEFVGEAVKDHMMTAGESDQKVLAVGIATWGIIDNRHSLEDGDGLFPADYNIDDLSPKDVRGVSPLNHNHTHFILVDDGTEGKFGGEIKFRASFEQYISENMETGVAKNQSVHVPVVLLVLEGGENTLVTAAQSTKEGTPVVIIQESGRAADYIAYAYRMSKETADEKTVFPANFDADMLDKAAYMFDWSREKDQKVKDKKMKKCVDNVKLVLEKRRMVTVFRMGEMDSADEIDQAILKALLKANKSDAQSQLNLALAWNRCDVARQEIFTIENRSQWQNMDLYEAMFTALVQDRVDFVKLFMDNGVDTKRFLTVRRLRDLYDDVVNDKYAGPSAELLKHMLLDSQQGYTTLCSKGILDDDLPNLLQIVGRIIDYLLGDQHKFLYSDERYVVKDSGDYEDRYNQPMLSSRSGYKKKQSLNAMKVQFDFDNPNRELFLWAVLLNRKDLAVLFWCQGKDHIGGALSASLILKSLSDEASREEEIDLSQSLQANSQMFEELAVGVLNKCYTRDKALSHQLLVRELSTWGDTTLLALADAGEHMDFMGHSSCQTLLNNIWMGKMALYTSTWKIIASLFCPILVLPFIKFNTNQFKSVTFGRKYDHENEEGLAHQQSPKTQVNKIVPQQINDDMAFSSIRRKDEKTQGVSKLYKVGFLSMDGNNSSVNFFQAIYYFQTAPFVKFCYHTFSFLVFLSMFSYFLLTDLRPISDDYSISIFEYIVWGWAFSLLVEEFRQIATMVPASLYYKLASYFSSSWNMFDMMVYVFLIISIILRCAVPDEHFSWARVFYTITLTMFFLRFLQTFFVEKNIGPKVIMIRRMLTDLMFFLMILIVFIFAFGVAAHAMRFPNAKLSWSILKDVVYMPYWQMYGELFLEDIQDGPEGCSFNATVYETNSGVERCPEYSWLAMVLLALYMILTNILLLNLLIAMFSYTFERVQENSEKVWRYYRYGLIYEYFDKPTLAPPLIILSLILRAIKYAIRNCRNITKASHDFRCILGEDENNKLTAFEQASMENFLLHRNLISKELIDAKIDSTGVKIEQVISDLEHIKESVVAWSGGGVDEGNNSSESVPPPTPSLTASLVAPGHQAPSSPQPRSLSPLPPVPAVDWSRLDVRDDISILHSRITGMETTLQDQQAQLEHMVALMQELVTTQLHSSRASAMPVGEPHISRHGLDRPDSNVRQSVSPDHRGYAYNLRQPQIEIQDYGDDTA